eukprot:CAMPEP_0204822474 /NCGR_PEP_ID=MMETSP1346-20131115/662_1 /ASSEMBLY_ACC=CAM_ASM_000771 /TAXON_ID=215587 /ORGANISM="Aplanochytrium stocchinoi, Strain GSBS06" /LENGTH=319 /DNA_ID=CAMNT_0051948687 /DNA_START=139 /DNA_END=1098 /DNA_ORIENTATION=+
MAFSRFHIPTRAYRSLGVNFEISPKRLLHSRTLTSFSRTQYWCLENGWKPSANGGAVRNLMGMCDYNYTNIHMKIHVQTYATTSDSEPENKNKDIVDDDATDDEMVPQTELHPLEKAKIWALQYGGYAGLSLVLTYAFYRTVHFTTSSLLSINFWDMGKYSFIIGILGGSVGTFMVQRTVQSLGIRPEIVRKAALQKVSKHPMVMEAMGATFATPLKGGLMRAYSKDGGYLAIDKNSRSIVWKKPRIKMLFQVYGGANQQAVVCVEAVKSNTKLEFDFISVDRITGEHIDPILVEGDEERFKVQGQLRDLVHLKKKYVS